MEFHIISIPRKEEDPGSFTLPCFINNVCFNNALADLGASVSVIPLSTYLNLGLGELAHTKLTVKLADRTVKYPKGIAKNVLVGIGKFVFSVDFIILDMLEDIKVPLILERPFLSITHAKIDVFKKKITLSGGEEKIIFKSVKPARILIKKVYMLSLRERMEPDLEARLIEETLVLNKSLDPFFDDYIELNDLNVPSKLKRDQVDDLMPTIEEGEVDKEFKAKNDARMYVNVMSKKFHNSIMRDKMEYKRNNVVGALMNIPVFVGTFSILIDFVVLEDMDAYRDVRMGDVIFGELFLREVGVNAKWFEGMITIHNGNQEFTYQMARSHMRFKHHTNEQCNKIPPLLKDLAESKEIDEAGEVLIILNPTCDCSHAGIHTERENLQPNESRRRIGVMILPDSIMKALENQLLFVSLLICLGKRDHVEKIPSVIKFGDSYKVPPEETAKDKGLAGEVSASTKKKGRIMAISAEDMQKRKNDTFGGNEATKKSKKNQLKQQYGNFKAGGSETLEQTFNRLHALVSHLEFMDVPIEQDDLNQKFLTSLAPEWLVYTIVWRNRDDLDIMSLDDVYNHLKVYKPEVQKRAGSNSQNIAFISSSNTSSGKVKFPVFKEFPLLGYMDEEEKDSKDHALVSNEEEILTEYALMARSSSSSDNVVYDDSFCFKSCRINTENLNTKISKLNEELSDYETDLYNYKRGGSSGNVVSKPMIKFVKESGCPNAIKVNNTENARKPTVKYAEMYRNTSQRENHGQDNMKYTSTHKSMTPRVVLLKSGIKSIAIYRPFSTDRPTLNSAQPKMTSFVKTAHSNVKRPFERKLAAKNKVWVPTVRPKIPTVGLKVPVAKATVASDKGNKGKAVKASARWIGNLSKILLVKASVDESMLWHMRLGHLNFKTINKLVRSNLVKGLPSKSFENDHSCIACLKGKQHKASYKSKLENSISKPLHTLHMDLFGPTSDETSRILRNFITEIENLKDHNVKIIKSDNGGEFRNKEMDEFYSRKGIKREFSNTRTPQQNGIAERRNKTLIEATRTMFADAKLPVTF
uniref:Integrase catalytic domain-containing protein n=1 Tax=Tanacetum cinerariifolium TaxID=118510 RepID=A0A6L2M604_TANCI|nr:hypothetical protein [Tanacetum cinerariifolium]